MKTRIHERFPAKSELRTYTENLANIAKNIKIFIANNQKTENPTNEAHTYRDMIEAYNRFCDVLDLLNARLASEPEGSLDTSWGKMNIQFPDPTEAPTGP